MDGLDGPVPLVAVCLGTRDGIGAAETFWAGVTDFGAAFGNKLGIGAAACRFCAGAVPLTGAGARAEFCGLEAAPMGIDCFGTAGIALGTDSRCIGAL